MEFTDNGILFNKNDFKFIIFGKSRLNEKYISFVFTDILVNSKNLFDIRLDDFIFSSQGFSVKNKNIMFEKIINYIIKHNLVIEQKTDELGILKIENIGNEFPIPSIELSHEKLILCKNEYNRQEDNSFFCKFLHDQ